MTFGATETDPLTAGVDVEKGTRASVFVDYSPPEDTKVLPPAKYKLFLIAYVIVYSANYVALRNMIPALTFGGRFDVPVALFLYLGVLVNVLVLGSLDLFVGTFTFVIKGAPLGVGAWLKAPRTSWLHRYDNFLAASLSGIVKIAEDGFTMFDAPPKEARRPEPETFEAESAARAELRVEHTILKTDEGKYAAWKAKIDGVAKRESGGFVCAEGKVETTGDGANTLLCTTSLVFEDVGSLNEWQLSPKRAVLIAEVRKLLVVPDVERLREARVLPDVFTDIAARQGASAPPMHPKKWKVAWLLTMSLYMCINWEGKAMAYYYDAWGWDPHGVKHDMLSLAIVIFLNDYVTVPLLLFLFDPWMARKEGEGTEDRQPWKTLENGIGSMGGQLLITLAFFAPNIYLNYTS